MHGVTHTIEQIRERGVPGFEVDVVGTDAGVDRRLPAAAELEVPFYEGMSARRARPARPGRDPRRGPLRPASTSPPPARPGSPRRCSAAITGMPLLASYHTELAAYAGMRSGDGGLRGDGAGGARRLLQRALGRPLAEPGGRRLAVRPRCRQRPDRSLGARCRHLPLRPGQGRPRRLPGRDQGPLRRPADPREGGRPARRELPPRPPQPSRGCTCCSPAAAPRRASCASGSASTPPSSAGSRARTWPAPTPAPTSSSSARRPTPTARWCSRRVPAGCR